MTLIDTLRQRRMHSRLAMRLRRRRNHRRCSGRDHLPAVVPTLDELTDLGDPCLRG